MSRELTHGDKQSWIDELWRALEKAEGEDIFRASQWDEICTAMAWITEELGLPTGADAEPD